MRGETHIAPTDRTALETVARYMLRCPVRLARLVWRGDVHKVVYQGQDGEPEEQIDACGFVARVLVHVPDPRRHLVFYFGAYSNAARGKRKKAALALQPADQPASPGAQLAWAHTQALHGGASRNRKSYDQRFFWP